MNILYLTKLSFTDLLKGYTEHFIAKENVKLSSTFKQTQDIKMLINKYTEQGARVVIRPSGTEPVLRVFVEHRDKKTANNMLSNLVYIIKNLPKHT